jgi:hypothetical protein
VVGSQLKNHSSSSLFVAKTQQRSGDGSQEIFVDPSQHEAELGARDEGRVRRLGVLQSPRDQIRNEVTPERGERRALRASQQDDHGLAVLQAEVEQLSGQHVIGRLARQLAHVARAAQGADALPRSFPQLPGERRGHDGVEQLVLVREVLVKITHGRAGALRHCRHRRGRETKLGESLGRGADEPLFDVRFGDLGH